MKQKKGKHDFEKRHLDNTKLTVKTSSNGRKEKNQLPECEPSGQGSIFPFPNVSPWIIYVITVSVRLGYVCRNESNWVYHPDEIFHGVEVSFSEVFGYGLRTPDYLPLPNSTWQRVGNQGRDVSSIFSLRSFLLPDFYAAVFWLLHSMQLSFNPYMISKMVHVCLTSFVPVTVYYTTALIFGNRDVSWMAAILVAFSHLLAVPDHHTVIQGFSAPFLFLAIYLALFSLQDNGNQGKSDAAKEQPTNNSTHSECQYLQLKERNKTANETPIDQQPKSKLNANHKIILAFSGGSLFGLLSYMSMENTVFIVIGSLFCLLYARKRPHFLTLVEVPLGFLVGLILGGHSDFVHYGTWFMSARQRYYNFHTSSEPNWIFRFGGLEMFLFEYVLRDVCTSTLYVVTAFVVCLLYTKTASKLEYYDKRATMGLIMLNVIYICAYCILTWPDPRSFHNVVIVNLILCAKAFHLLFHDGTFNFLRQLKSRFVIYGLLCIYGVNSYVHFQSPSSDLSIHLTRQAIVSADVNTCLMYVSQQDDVTGLMVDQNLHYTAGFSILNKDIPILILIQNDYHEYSGKKGHDRIINRFSDIIHASNVIYLTKFLFNNFHYNYVITKFNRKDSFEDMGYKEVFTYRTHVVLKRTLSSSGIRKAMDYGMQVAYGDNATVLEYEASWLFTLGHFQKAVERAAAALAISGERVRLFQILGLSYTKLDKWDEARRVEMKCFKTHGEKKCKKQQSRLML